MFASPFPAPLKPCYMFAVKCRRSCGTRWLATPEDPGEGREGVDEEGGGGACESGVGEEARPRRERRGFGDDSQLLKRTALVARALTTIVLAAGLSLPYHLLGGSGPQSRVGERKRFSERARARERGGEGGGGGDVHYLHGLGRLRLLLSSGTTTSS